MSEAVTLAEPVHLPTTKRADLLIKDVYKKEEELFKSTDEFVRGLTVQLNNAGISESQFEDEDFNYAARRLFLEAAPSDEKGLAEIAELRNKYPVLSELSDRNRQEIDLIQSQRLEVKKLKTLHLPELTSLLSEEFDYLTSHLDYDQLLETQGDKYQLLEDLFSVNRLVENRDGIEDEYVFDIKARAHQTAVTLTEKYQSYLKAEANDKPDEKTIKSAVRKIAGVKRTVKRIDFHNDLGGLTGSKDYIEVPELTKIVSRLPKTQNSILSIQNLNENPYLLTTVAKRIKAETAGLKLNSKQTWENVINSDLIYSIVEKVDTQYANLNPQAREKVIVDITRRYQELFNVNPDNRPKDTSELAYDSLFVDTILEFVKESSPMTPLDKRILNSQMVALNFLFTAHGIDRLYEDYLSKVPPNETPQTKQQEWKAKSVLAMDFLRRNAIKNRESIIDRLNPEAPTVGIEYEYIDRLEGLVFPDTEANRFIDQVLKSIEEGRQKGEDTTSLEAFLLQLQEVKKAIVENSNQILFGDKDKDEGLAERLKIASLLIADPTTTQTVAKLGTFSEDLEHSPFYREIITNPSISYRLQIRELIHVMAKDALKTNLNPHFTIGGVELSVERPEASELRILMMAAGYVDLDEKVLNETYIKGDENFWKLTKHEGKYYYLPYHSVRKFGEMQNYNTRYTPFGFEIRTFTQGTSQLSNFPNHIRSLAFLSSAAFGLQANQKDPILRTKREEKLSKLWETAMMDWKKLLSESGVEFLPLDKRFTEVEADDSEYGLKFKDQETKDAYRKYMTAVLKASQNNPDFRAKTRQIIGNYKRRANKLIGY